MAVCVLSQIYTRTTDYILLYYLPMIYEVTKRSNRHERGKDCHIWRDNPGIFLGGLRDMANCFISPLLGFESGYKTLSVAVMINFSALSCQCCQLCYSTPKAFLANTTNCNVHLLSSLAIMVDYFFSRCWLFLVCWKHSQLNYPSKERLK
jgi:hypothetical protein